jgi:hypothetical protein
LPSQAAQSRFVAARRYPYGQLFSKILRDLSAKLRDTLRVYAFLDRFGAEQGGKLLAGQSLHANKQSTWHVRAARRPTLHDIVDSAPATEIKVSDTKIAAIS